MGIKHQRRGEFDNNSTIIPPSPTPQSQPCRSTRTITAKVSKWSICMYSCIIVFWCSPPLQPHYLKPTSTFISNLWNRFRLNIDGRQMHRTTLMRMNKPISPHLLPPSISSPHMHTHVRTHCHLERHYETPFELITASLEASSR
jgi:hypothetical protein